jgi:SAM-dependent methyltransferase
VISAFSRWSPPHLLEPERLPPGVLHAMTSADSPHFDFEELFGEDYLYFYEQSFTAERNRRETEAVWKLLELSPGQAVLDLGCGHGRISNALAEYGARVTGLDASVHFLDLARKDAALRGLDVNFEQGDMRDIPWNGTFDAALIWFTTFGYFSDADNVGVVQQVAKALKPHGRLLIEQINRVALLRSGQPSNSVVSRGDDLMIDRIDYDGLTDRSITERIVVRAGHVKRARFTVRLYSPAEFSSLMRGAGFRSCDVFGQDGEPYTLYGRRLIVVGIK